MNKLLKLENDLLAYLWAQHILIVSITDWKIINF